MQRNYNIVSHKATVFYFYEARNHAMDDLTSKSFKAAASSPAVS